MREGKRTVSLPVRSSKISLPLLLVVVMVEIYSVTADRTVASRSVITFKALNKANASREIVFEVELPKTAFISNFSSVMVTLSASWPRSPTCFCSSQENRWPSVCWRG